MIKISIDNEKCIPTKTHKWDAGWDLKSNNETFIIKPNDKVKVHTGVRIAIPPRFVGIVAPRSGLGTKFRVTLANIIGVIDSEYRGEILVTLVNDGDDPLEIKQFDRFCQLLIIPVNLDRLRIVDILDETARGDNGFGSTGIASITDEDAIDDLELEEILQWTEENLSAIR